MAALNHQKGEMTMDRSNGSMLSSPNGVAHGMGKLTRDIVSLAALQIELLRDDCREGIKRMLIPAALLLVAGVTAAGTMPIALILIAELLVEAGGLSRPVAFLIAALTGLTASTIIGVAGWLSMCKAARVFDRSREEWTRNTAWIRRAVKPTAAIE